MNNNLEALTERVAGGYSRAEICTFGSRRLERWLLAISYGRCNHMEIHSVFVGSSPAMQWCGALLTPRIAEVGFITRSARLIWPILAPESDSCLWQWQNIGCAYEMVLLMNSV